MEGFWDKQQQKQQLHQQQNKCIRNNKYISVIADPISAKLEIITTATETTETTTAKTKITRHTT